MGENNHIVVGLDQKRSAPLAYALLEAHRRHLPLRLVHAWPVMSPPFGEAGTVPDVQPVETIARSLIDDATNQIASVAVDVKVDYVLKAAPALALLLEQGRDAEEFVLGHNELPWYERLFTGTVAGGLMRLANSPVVVVPDDWNPQVTHPGGIVVTVHGDSDPEPLLEYAFARAKERHCKLTVLHAVTPGTMPSDIDESEAMLAEMTRSWAEQYPEVPVEQVVVESEKRSALLAATHDADLLVVGRPNSKLARFALARPLAVLIAKEAGCPVAAIPH